ncbi:hypothetical protein scyTo_0024008, partial [Scyliorhinus torazame]|nr:hypothetical protein [Scyliorhinus torazame]
VGTLKRINVSHCQRSIDAERQIWNSLSYVISYPWNKVHPSGASFVLSDGDGKNVTVEMTDP